MKSTRIALALALSLSGLAVGCTTEAVDDTGASDNAVTGTGERVEPDATPPKVIVGDNLGISFELRLCSDAPITAANAIDRLDNGKCPKGTALIPADDSGALSFKLAANGAPAAPVEGIYVSLRVQDGAWPSFYLATDKNGDPMWAMDKGVTLGGLDAMSSQAADGGEMPTLHFDPPTRTKPFWPSVYAEGHAASGAVGAGSYDIQAVAWVPGAAENARVCAGQNDALTMTNETPERAYYCNRMQEIANFKLELLPAD